MSDITTVVLTDDLIDVTNVTVLDDVTSVGPTVDATVILEVGTAGPPGDGGDSVPDGGTTGQVLTKESNADGDAGWEDPAGGDVDAVDVTFESTAPATWEALNNATGVNPDDPAEALDELADGLLSAQDGVATVQADLNNHPTFWRRRDVNAFSQPVGNEFVNVVDTTGQASYPLPSVIDVPLHGQHLIAKWDAGTDPLVVTIDPGDVGIGGAFDRVGGDTSYAFTWPGQLVLFVTYPEAPLIWQVAAVSYPGIDAALAAETTACIAGDAASVSTAAADATAKVATEAAQRTADDTATLNAAAADATAKVALEATARTTAITAAVTALVGGAPGALDTLKELADAVNDDASFAATVATSLAGKQGLSAVLTALVANGTPTATGLALLIATNAAAARSTLGLGTSAVKDAPATGDATSGQVVLGSDTRLTDTRTPVAQSGNSVLANATGSSASPSALSMSASTILARLASGNIVAATPAQLRTLLGLVIGTDVQAADSTLTALAGLATGANKLAYSTGTDTFAQTDLTAFARTLLDDPDIATFLATIGMTNAMANSTLATQVGRSKLATWYTVWDALRTATGSVDVVWVSDSIMVLGGTANTLGIRPNLPTPWRVAKVLQQKTFDAHTTTSPIRGVYTGQEFASGGGGVPQLDTLGGTPTETGAGGYATALANTQTTSTTMRADKFAVVWSRRTTGGKLTVSDGGGTLTPLAGVGGDGISGTQIDTSGATKGSRITYFQTTNGLASDSVITITGDTTGGKASPIVEMVQPFTGNMTKGVRVWVAGHAGYTTSSFTGNADRAYDLIERLSAGGGKVLVINCTGQNDTAAQITSNFPTHYAALVAALASAGQSWIVQYVTASTAEQAAAMRTAGAAYEQVDIAAQLGSTSLTVAPNTPAATGDGVHPTNAERQTIADAFVKALTGDPEGTSVQSPLNGSRDFAAGTVTVTGAGGDTITTDSVLGSITLILKNTAGTQELAFLPQALASLLGFNGPTFQFGSDATFYRSAASELTLVAKLVANTATADTQLSTLGQTKTGTITMTNKRITRRVVVTTQSATPTINTDNTDVASITALAQAITSMTTNLTGTPVAGDELRIEITDNGTARAIAWGTSFEASTVALPTTTVLNAKLTSCFMWNAATSKWRLMWKA